MYIQHASTTEDVRNNPIMTLTSSTYKGPEVHCTVISTLLTGAIGVWGPAKRAVALTAVCRV